MSAQPRDADVVTLSTTASGVPVRVVPDKWQTKEDCLALTVSELTWLDRFRAQLLNEFPEHVEDLIVYGLRARGYADDDLDMLVLVVIAEKFPSTKEHVDDMAYDIGLEVNTIPLVHVKTRAEWEKNKKRSSHWTQPSTEGISVL